MTTPPQTQWSAGSFTSSNATCPGLSGRSREKQCIPYSPRVYTLFCSAPSGWEWGSTTIATTANVSADSRNWELSLAYTVAPVLEAAGLPGRMGWQLSTSLPAHLLSTAYTLVHSTPSLPTTTAPGDLNTRDEPRADQRPLALLPPAAAAGPLPDTVQSAPPLYMFTEPFSYVPPPSGTTLADRLQILASDMGLPMPDDSPTSAAEEESASK